jgi:hypothetical protein
MKVTNQFHKLVMCVCLTGLSGCDRLQQEQVQTNSNGKRNIGIILSENYSSGRIEVQKTSKSEFFKLFHEFQFQRLVTHDTEKYRAIERRGSRNREESSNYTPPETSSISKCAILTAEFDLNSGVLLRVDYSIQNVKQGRNLKEFYSELYD